MTKLGENVTCCTTSAAQRSSRMTQSDSKTRSTTRTLKSGTKPAHHGEDWISEFTEPKEQGYWTLTHIMVNNRKVRIIVISYDTFYPCCFQRHILCVDISHWQPTRASGFNGHLLSDSMWFVIPQKVQERLIYLFQELTWWSRQNR